MKLSVNLSSPWRFNNSPHLEKADLPFWKFSGIGLWSYGLGRKTVWLINVACASACLLDRSKTLKPQLVENTSMFCLKSKFISLFLPAYSNPKHQEGTLGSVLTKRRDGLYLGIHWYSRSPLMTTSVSKHNVGAQQIKIESTSPPGYQIHSSQHPKNYANTLGLGSNLSWLF